MATATVQSNFINNAQWENYPITPTTTAKQLVHYILHKHGMGARDPNLFYLTVTNAPGSSGTKDIFEETHPYLLLRANSSIKFVMQMRPGGLVKVYDSCLFPESYYKSFFIAKQTTAQEVIQLLLSSYNHQEDSSHFSLVEKSLKGEEIRILRPDDCPLLCVKNVKNVQLHLKRVDTMREDVEAGDERVQSGQSRDTTIQRLRESFHWLHKMRTNNNTRLLQGASHNHLSFGSPRANSQLVEGSKSAASFSLESLDVLEKPKSTSNQQQQVLEEHMFFEDEGNENNSTPTEQDEEFARNASLAPGGNEGTLKYRSRSFHTFKSNNTNASSLFAPTRTDDLYLKDRSSLNDLKLALDDNENDNVAEEEERESDIGQQVQLRQPEVQETQLRRHKSLFAPKSARYDREYSRQQSVWEALGLSPATPRNANTAAAAARAAATAGSLTTREGNSTSTGLFSPQLAHMSMKPRRVLPQLPAFMMGEEGSARDVPVDAAPSTSSSSSSTAHIPMRQRTSYTLSEETQRILRSLSQRHMKAAEQQQQQQQSNRTEAHRSNNTNNPLPSYSLYKDAGKEEGSSLDSMRQQQYHSYSIQSPITYSFPSHSSGPVPSHPHQMIPPPSCSPPRCSLFELVQSHRILCAHVGAHLSSTLHVRCYVSQWIPLHTVHSNEIRSGPEGRRPNLLLLSPRHAPSSSGSSGAFDSPRHVSSSFSSSSQVVPVLRLEMMTAGGTLLSQQQQQQQITDCEVRNQDVLLEVDGLDTFRRDNFSTREIALALEQRVNALLQRAITRGESVKLLIAREVAPLSREDRDLLSLDDAPPPVEWNKNYSLLIEKYIQLKLHVAKTESLLRDMQRSLSERVSVQEVAQHDQQHYVNNNHHGKKEVVSSTRSRGQQQMQREFREKAKDLAKGFVSLETAVVDVLDV